MAATFSRRDFVVRSTRLLAGASLSVHGQSTLSSSPTSDEGAWTLWATLIDKLVADYYVPLEESALTQLAVDELIASQQLSQSLRPRDYGTTPTENRRAFQEFILKITRLAGAGAASPTTLVERALELLCDRHLDFTSYAPARIYDQFKRSGDSGPPLRFIIQDQRILCLPPDRGEAQQRGIRTGDELFNVDGNTVQGLNIFRLKPRLFGSEGSKVELAVKQASGRILSTSVTRQRNSTARTALIADAAGERLRIPSFDSGTAAEVRDALRKISPSYALVIDLRSNSGGEFQAAADVVGLLSGGDRPAKVGSKKQRGQADTDIITTERSVSTFKRLTLLQDAGTASAAEFMVAALRLDPSLRVTIGGQTSFGKDLWNWEGEVPGGGFLHIARGTLATSDGQGWAGGIKPTF